VHGTARLGEEIGAVGVLAALGDEPAPDDAVELLRQTGEELEGLAIQRQHGVEEGLMEDVGRRAGLRHDDEVRGVLAVRRADECLEPGEVRVDLPEGEGGLDDGDTSHVKALLPAWRTRWLRLMARHPDPPCRQPTSHRFRSSRAVGGRYTTEREPL
jgi:hypothetical protein